MPLPKPEPGLVVRYDYLWQREADREKSAGKERPACIVASLDDETEPRIVVILPITHSAPTGDSVAVEIGPEVSRKLGLDEARSWIVISEANVDYWPNPGLVPLPKRRNVFAYGYLPPAFFERVRARFAKLLAEGQAKLIRRRS